MDPYSAYVAALNKGLSTGAATEHTHRPALKTLIESIASGITVINEPKRIACGAPDFSILRKTNTVGHVETKDVGLDLDDIDDDEHSAQFDRYLAGLGNWLLTDYLTFHWYVAGEKRKVIEFAKRKASGQVVVTADGVVELKELLEAFIAQPPIAISSASELAKRIAGLARIIRSLITATFKAEPAKGWLHSWLVAFREVLIPKLEPDDFADMFAQTLAYGLFAARVHTPKGAEFRRELAAYQLPKTNPFLRKLFAEIAGVDMPDTIAWAVDDLVEVLKYADMEKVLQDFGKGTGKQDPVFHFYETFLAAYDPALRDARGVYYTPEPVVRYIVLSLDRLLVTRFDRQDGLADENTIILDPAVGTATFLRELVRTVHDRLQGQSGIWDDYVASNLLKRVFGFELLMAPYAVAHLKLGIELEDTGYSFASEQRLGIYLTNTLEEAVKKGETLFASWISDEASAAADIKRKQPILAILGNPPYFGQSSNKSRDDKGNLTFIGALIEDYKKVDGKPLKEKTAKWLQDDYVKFIRFSQWRIERTGEGLIGFITNHGYLDNPTFRGMRWNLMNTFSEIYVYDLHGRQNQRTPDGAEDKNVFDITRGVSIVLCIKKKNEKGPAVVRHAELWGSRSEKYTILGSTTVEDTAWTQLEPSEPFFFFIPQDADLKAEYEQAVGLKEMFVVGGAGITTARDEVVIDFEREPLLEQRAKVFRDSPLSDEKVCDELRIPLKAGWDPKKARNLLRAETKLKKLIEPIAYRPFDNRFIFYHDSMVWRTARQVMEHMLGGENLGLISARSNKSSDMNHFFCTRHLMEAKCGESTTQSYLFPLYVEGKGGGLYDGRANNLSPAFLKRLATALGKKQGADGLPQNISPEEVFYYAYAVFHSPTYRVRYAPFLMNDFPRLPVTSNLEVFLDLADLGHKLVETHLLTSPALAAVAKTVTFPVSGTSVVAKVTYKPGAEEVWINKTQFFGGVPEDVWEFHVGGYQVCDKWLKYRRERNLTYRDVQHFQNMVAAIAETLRLMAEVDAHIPSWPLQ